MKVIREIDRGGFGRVEEVELPTGERQARKVFDPNQTILQATPLTKLKARFAREVRVQSNLPHHYFVPIYDYELVGDNPWYTMPLCHRNFQSEIEECRQRNEIPEDALADILNALEELHSLGLVHRDLNPRNILLHDGTWKLSDFGLVSPPSGETTQITSTLAGWRTPFYCAPEQVADFKQATPKADIYAFGCILHDIFSGATRVPYAKQSCNGGVGLLIERCTDEKPERRYESIEKLRSALYSVVRTSASIHLTVAANEWIDKLKDPRSWNTNDLQEFTKFVSQTGTTDELSSVFPELTNEVLVAFHEIDKGWAETVGLEYCEWVMTTSFEFSFCDIVVSRLSALVEYESLNCRSRAILAIAKLGSSHNRYYVMRRLVRHCGENLDSGLANRLALEIQVENAQTDFLRSIRAIGIAIEELHPTIRETLL